MEIFHQIYLHFSGWLGSRIYSGGLGIKTTPWARCLLPVGYAVRPNRCGMPNVVFVFTLPALTAHYVRTYVLLTVQYV